MLHASRSSYKWSPWTNIDRWSEPRAMGHTLPPSPSSRGCSAISYTRVPAEAQTRLQCVKPEFRVPMGQFYSGSLEQSPTVVVTRPGCSLVPDGLLVSTFGPAPV